MSRNKNRKRPQATKPAKSGNQPYIEAMLDLRQGSRTDRHRSAKDYRRKPKHSGRGWE